MKKTITQEAEKGKVMTLRELRAFVEVTSQLPPETPVASQTTMMGWLKVVRVTVHE